MRSILLEAGLSLLTAQSQNTSSLIEITGFQLGDSPATQASIEKWDELEPPLSLMTGTTVYSSNQTGIFYTPGTTDSVKITCKVPAAVAEIPIANATLFATFKNVQSSFIFAAAENQFIKLQSSSDTPGFDYWFDFVLRIPNLLSRLSFDNLMLRLPTFASFDNEQDLTRAWIDPHNQFTIDTHSLENEPSVVLNSRNIHFGLQVKQPLEDTPTNTQVNETNVNSYVLTQADANTTIVFTSDAPIIVSTPDGFEGEVILIQAGVGPVILDSDPLYSPQGLRSTDGPDTAIVLMGVDDDEVGTEWRLKIFTGSLTDVFSRGCSTFKAFKDRWTVTLPLLTQAFMDQVIREGIASGWWQKLDGFYFMALSQGYEQPSLLNWVQDKWNLVNTPNGGTPLPLADSAGYRGGASSNNIAYLDFKPYLYLGSQTKYQKDDAFMSEFASSLDYTASNADMGTEVTGFRAALRARFKGVASAWANTDGTAAFNIPIAAAVGLLSFSRLNSASFLMFKNTSVYTKAANSVALPKSNSTKNRFVLLRNGGSSNIYGGQSMALFAFGSGFSVADHNSYNDTIHRLMLRLGIIDPAQDLDPAPSGTNYFTPQMDALLPFRVIMQGTPPASDAVDNTTYVQFPLTHAWYTGNYTATTWSGNCIASIWANRYNPPDQAVKLRPNVVAPTIYNSQGVECRAVYSDIPTAMLSTVCAVMRHCGYTPDQIRAYVASQGYDPANVILYYDMLNNPDGYFSEPITSVNILTGQSVTYACIRDKFWIDDWSDNDSFQTDAIQLDYECNDQRTDAQTLNLIQTCVNFCNEKNYKLLIYTDPLSSKTAIRCGLSNDIVNTIVNIPNVIMGLLLSSKTLQGGLPVSLPTQVAALRGPKGNLSFSWSQVFLSFELGVFDPLSNFGGTTIADAYTVRNAILQNGAYGMTFWKNLATLGGARTRLTNQKIEALCFGTWQDTNGVVHNAPP